jgi:hypothetical protein
MDALRALISIGIPWLAGAGLVCALQSRSRTPDAPGEIAWMLGVGYAVGAFVLTLWMRALSLAHVSFGILPVALPMLALAAASYWLAHRASSGALVGKLRRGLRFIPADLDRSMVWVWWLLIAWIAARLLLLGVEVALRPLYPWDAWIQWATKARVWYDLGYMAPFGRADAWLNSRGAMYFDASPEYPPTMPLLQVWSCMVLGRWSDTLMNWPWWMLLLSLVLSIYGGLRSIGIGATTGLVAAAFAATLPLADVHVALAGYADLPMAVYYTMGVLGLLRWSGTRTRADAAIVALLAIACTQIKNPGIVWALTLVPGILVVVMPRRGLRIVAALFAAAALLLAVFAQTDPMIYNYRLHLDFNPDWAALGQTLFLLDNWHLLWYAVLVAAALAGRQLVEPALRTLTMVMIAAILFLAMVFGFTNASIWVSDQTTVNRAILHFAPVALVFAVMAFDAFTRRWYARHPSPQGSHGQGADSAVARPSIPAASAP